ncbi:unnamed protein product (macronuclear) [Paramecium tetraurelia]|uniref:Uncharacterized protein n=1 Tax=Paramecium tetraurelia TaxID=5888 RepID=A0DDT3_PARTE|nr:uncharacterized protein GSPATT00016041001 [Paramecium tetraurelia]CAK81200.1 unnamed protein product [Paramecium tetraurelia]|eukprot:XP_001448597.1 hypothetical protein (macronuclear) [Paramecium tetraurelia strain d4-2]
MQQRLQTHATTEEGRKSSSEIISPLREMYQIRRNVMKLEKQRTDESCHRKSQEFIKHISQSHRDAIIPQQLKFEDNLDGSRATINSINSVAQHYEIIKPNLHHIDWNKENNQNQSNKNKHHQKCDSNKHKTKFIQLDNQRQQINKTIQQMSKCNRQLANVLKAQVDKLFDTIKTDYTYA